MILTELVWFVIRYRGRQASMDGPPTDSRRYSWRQSNSPERFLNPSTTSQKATFHVPTNTKSWHFDRPLKPDDNSISEDEFATIVPGPSDILKVLKSYSHHPVPGYNIASIRIAYKETLNRSFYWHLHQMEGMARRFVPSWKTAEDPPGPDLAFRLNAYKQFKEICDVPDPQFPSVSLLPLWHGTSDERALTICKTGFVIDGGTATDEGFFGKGVYGAYEAEYAFRCYAEPHGTSAVLLLAWFSTLETYPIVEQDLQGMRGAQLRGARDALEKFCDSHFIPVRSDTHPNGSFYNPCSPKKPEHHYRELVVFNPPRCLPRYLVKLIKSTPQPSIDHVYREAFQMGISCLQKSELNRAIQLFSSCAPFHNYPLSEVRLHWIFSGFYLPAYRNEDALVMYCDPSPGNIIWIKNRANFKHQNDPEAQFCLGWCYENGLGVQIDLPKAVKYYWIAMEQGHIDAKCHFSLCYGAGRGVARDFDKAVIYLDEAAKSNSILANYTLSRAYNLPGYLPRFFSQFTHLSRVWSPV